MKTKIEALVFAAYGTLFDVHSVISICNQKFPDQGPALSRAWRANQLEYTWLRSLMGRYEDFWRVTESALLLQKPRSVVAASHERRIDECVSPPAVLSRSLPGPQGTVRLCARHPLERLSEDARRRGGQRRASRMFSQVLSVDEVKIYKPSPRAYQLACDKMGLESTAIGFVSSNCWDVVGAKNFGFWTCWVNRSKAPQDELGFAPDVVADSLTDLVNAVKA